MTFDREELLSALADASPALAKTSTIPGLDHFWFDGDFVYAYDGGLGVRVAFKNELECGLPGRALLDLLKTSALKQVDCEFDKKDVVLKMGRAKVNLSSLDSDQSAWAFPIPSKKIYEKAIGDLELTEDVLEAITRVSFVRMSGSKPMRVIDNGVTIIPQKNSIEFYATDSVSIARTQVKAKPPKDMPQFVAPWAFVDRFLELAEPGAILYIMEDCLMVDSKDVLICSNILDLPEDPSITKTLDPHIRDSEDPEIELPPGLQAVLDRAVILAGQDEAIIKVSTEGKSLLLEGKYGLGSLDEEVTLKEKVDDVTAKFPAHLIRRGLSQAKHFLLSSKALVMDDGADFVYVLAAKHEAADTRKGRKDTAEVGERRKPSERRRGREPEGDDAEAPVQRRRPARRGDLDDEIPF